ncbi:hypothetical protein C8Q75DRAFT_464827 [Abortiporus biennis]|nr:hypothetical protein C8Q75DRAFT_464827 [Abortiporus biennis]
MTDSIDVGKSHPRPIVSQQSNMMILDHDTLLLVFDFVERANDMLNLLKSCKAFYNIGRTNLLGSPLRFKDDASRLKFQAFMAHIKKNPSDIQYVKHLSIVDIPEFGKTSVTNFALEFLQKGTNLQFLKVSRTSVIPSTITRYDDFTTSRLHLPSFNFQTTSCPKLEHLNVRNLDDEAVVKILRYLDSPLKYLNISLRGLRRRWGTSRRIIYHYRSLRLISSSFTCLVYHGRTMKRKRRRRKMIFLYQLGTQPP